MPTLKAALGWLATAVVKDVLVRPKQFGKLARAYCDRVGKPLLYVHGNGLQHHIFGSPVAAEVVSGVYYPHPVPSGYYGAVLAVDALEHAHRPDLAMAEWRRIADRVLVVVPSWWSPLAWVPWKRWQLDADVQVARSVWSGRSVSLITVSDRRYGPEQWKPKSSLPRPPERSLQPKPEPKPAVASPDSESSSSASALTVISSRSNG